MSGRAAGSRVLVVEHEADTGAGIFGARLRAQGLELDVARMHAAATLPDHLAGYAGLLVLGGTPHPYEDHLAPWLPATCELIRQAVDAQLPFLGICLGAQLFARALGGRAEPLAAGPEIGLHHVTTTPAAADDPLFAAVPPRAAVVQWHWVEIAEPPPGALLLATSEACRVQALRVEPCAWALQFHLEVATEAIREWARGDHNRLHELGLDPQRVVAGVERADAELRGVWEPFADRWAQVVLAGVRSPSRSGSAARRRA